MNTFGQVLVHNGWKSVQCGSCVSKLSTNILTKKHTFTSDNYQWNVLLYLCVFLRVNVSWERSHIENPLVHSCICPSVCSFIHPSVRPSIPPSIHPPFSFLCWGFSSFALRLYFPTLIKILGIMMIIPIIIIIIITTSTV